ncbi:hypothetical protein GH733_009420, partial [Mirounga leonina]
MAAKSSQLASSLPGGSAAGGLWLLHQAIEALPPDKYGQNESFAQIQVRFAELKAIQEPDDAHDCFQMARANCKKFVFVHIPFVQFELSQGNFKKSKQLLHKTVECGAVPLEMPEIAIRNLNLQKQQLSEEEKKSLLASTNRNISCDSRGQTRKARFLYGENMPPQDTEIGHRNPLKQTKLNGRAHLEESHPDYGKTDGSVVPSLTRRQMSGSERRDMIVPGCKSSGNDSSELRNLKSIQNIHSKEPLMSDKKSSELITETESSLLTKLEETKEHQEPKVPESNQKHWQSMRNPECSPPISAPKWTDPKSICKTPSSSALDDYISCFRTPVEKNDFPPACQLSTPYSQLAYFQQQRQQIPATPLQTLQISAPSSTNECILVKGRMYSILKQIGSGDSSKVFQVLNEKKQIRAIKYVNLEEADNQTTKSYRNEIAYLNKLQQHSDKIIQLYDYEITDQYILHDLNSWLKKKKSINPWERKRYWKSTLEAVYTIHQHGIVHSDLKPANFLIISKLPAIINPNHEIKFPDIPEKDLQDVLKCCLIRDPKQRISIPELLAHPYVQIQTHPGNQMAKGTTEEMKYVLGQL